MKINIDRENNVAYVQLVGNIEKGQVTDTIPADCPAGSGYIFLDFNKEGKLLGIEIVGAATVLADELICN